MGKLELSYTRYGVQIVVIHYTGVGAGQVSERKIYNPIFTGYHYVLRCPLPYAIIVCTKEKTAKRTG